MSDGLKRLREAVEAMTKAPWRSGPDEFAILGDCDHPDGPVEILHMEGEALNADNPGIVALRNAAPALLDLAEAVKAYVESDDEDRAAEFDAMACALAALESIL